MAPFSRPVFRGASSQAGLCLVGSPKKQTNFPVLYPGPEYATIQISHTHTPNLRTCIHSRMMQAGQGIFPPCKAKIRSNTWCIARIFPGAKSRLRRLRLDAPAGAATQQGGKRPDLTASDGCEYRFYSNHQNWRHTAGRGAFSAAEAPKTQEALMAFKFLGQRQLGKLPSRWVSTILMVAINGKYTLQKGHRPVPYLTRPTAEGGT